MEGDLELQLDSSYQEVSDRALIVVLGNSMETEEESGARNIQVNTCNVDQDVKGYLNEKIGALNMSCSGYVGNLTRISNKITHLREQVCLGIVPVKVQGKGSDRLVETYALLGN